MHRLPESTRERLARLRATDTTGLYAGEQPTSGTDPGGVLTVTLDPTLRVTRVAVRDVEQARTPDAVRTAFEEAYRSALAQRLPRDEPPAGTRPVARRIRRVSAAPTPERLARHQARYQRDVDRRRAPGLVTGRSDNDCVTVTLPPASPHGRLDIDPAWLAVTTRSSLGVAITEAFSDAYARRDQP